MAFSSASTVGKTITLKSGSGDGYKVSLEAIIRASGTLRNILNDVGNVEKIKEISFSTLSSDVLKGVTEWMEHHKNDELKDYVITTNIPMKSDPSKKLKRVVFSECDIQLFGGMDAQLRAELMEAAHELEIEGLVEMCAAAIAKTVHGKSKKERDQILHLLIPPAAPTAAVDVTKQT